ncbi:MAG: type 4a pilus biogenesis protein PilO [Candidatus Sumerlaeia bacterium]
MTLTPEDKKKLTSIIAIGLLGLGVIAYLYWMFGSSSIAQAETNIKKGKEKIEQLEKELAAIKQFNELKGTPEYNMAMQRIEKASKRLPKTTRAQDFYKALQDILEQTGITNIVTMMPENVEVYNTFAEIPYKIDMDARFHAFGYFLNMVEENPKRFMRVKTFKISNNPLRPSLHPIDVTIASFMLTDLKKNKEDK